ncbi:taurine catabolism dioxygenase [Aaosphaeria arxii CBS 175.79]|uniref:Taurine catabolism dioxygenase n=1 Tax=Aaosphaeria arxii CBS 175.79 TaxID=1450172 RepID=A0A6A5Y1V2_9PLEO|nr:taurine catabolism dioxygenase [Aaosphaeria arxii CBS 175.79]KAF2018534.1 taurine catabolism dioxygenase [Aaosphaeria arxii CBS 175.79]
MAPSLVETETQTSEVPFRTIKAHKPLQLSGVLNQFESFDVTPVIGREFPKANVVDWLNAPNSDELIRDLAITISERGVVFFRAQDNLTNDIQKDLIRRLGQLTTRPETSDLHIHPILNSERDLGGEDPQISTISSVQNKKLYKGSPYDNRYKNQSSAQWHADISFEPVPADYTSLRLTELPRTGGDTLWASGYELYDRISTPYQRFLDGLDATFSQPAFKEVAERGGFQLYDKPRGAPENVGSDLTAVHPVVRTNPVTGWKSVFPVGGHVRSINGLAKQESEDLLKWFLRLVQENHDLQVRFRWNNKNDLAIWDNRSVFHSATFDYDGHGDRFGNRVVGLGERPFHDPGSKSRREALGQLDVV